MADMVKKYFDHPKIYGGDEIKTALTTKNEKQKKNKKKTKQKNTTVETADEGNFTGKMLQIKLQEVQKESVKPNKRNNLMKNYSK